MNGSTSSARSPNSDVEPDSQRIIELISKDEEFEKQVRRFFHKYLQKHNLKNTLHALVIKWL